MEASQTIQAVRKTATCTAAGISDRLLAGALRLRNNGATPNARKIESVPCPLSRASQALMSVVDYHECVWPQPKPGDERMDEDRTASAEPVFRVLLRNAAEAPQTGVNWHASRWTLSARDAFV